MLNRKILQSRYGLCWLEQSIPLFVHFFILFLKTQALCQPLLVLVVCNSTTIHQNLYSFVLYFGYLSSWHLMASKALVVKLEWGHLESTHQICYFSVPLILPLPRHVSTLPFWVYNSLLHLALLRCLQLQYCMTLYFYSWIFFFMTFHKIKSILF